MEVGLEGGLGFIKIGELPVVGVLAGPGEGGSVASSKGSGESGGS